MAYDVFTTVAEQLTGAVGDVATNGAEVVGDVSATAANDSVVSALLVGGAGYYGYKKYKA